MKEPLSKNKFRVFYLTPYFFLLALPLFTISPWFFPPDWGKTLLFRVIIVALIFLYTIRLLYKKEELPLHLKDNTLFWLFGIFWIVFLLATIFSVDPYFSVWGSPTRGGGFITFSAYFFFAILIFLEVKSENWKKMWDFSFGVGTMVCVVAMIQYYGLLSNIFISVPNRPPSTLGNPDFLAVYVLLLFFPVLMYAIKERILIRKILYAACATFFSYTILITNSRAAYLGLFAGIIYFLLFYPKKKMALKVSAGILLLLFVLLFYFANTNPIPPSLIAKNHTLSSFYSRLSLSSFWHDARFYAWEVSFNALKEKPILGWGPENVPVAFDANYDPSLPYIGNISSNWWDKAHNIFLDTGIQAGFLGILAYIIFNGYLFWKLRKATTIAPQPDIKMQTHMIGATLIGYLVANFFSFDNFATYLMYFLLVGYSFHLLHGTSQQSTIRQPGYVPHSLFKKRIWIVTILSLITVYVMWQYHLKPFIINTNINIASNLIEAKKCEQAFKIMDGLTSQHSFLYVYTRTKYVDVIKSCVYIHPENDLTYTNKAVLLMKEAVVVQPLFSRIWIFLGAFTNIQAGYQQDPTTKNQLIEDAGTYLKKAQDLAPNHQEIIIEEAKNQMVKKDYQTMKQVAERCIAIYPTSNDCHWMKIFSEVYLHEIEEAKKDIAITIEKNYSSNDIPFLKQLADAYSATENYQELATTYERMIRLNPYEPQYHASLAFTYRELKRYRQAEEQAILFLQLMPAAKEEVDAFLKTIPAYY